MRTISFFSRLQTWSVICFILITSCACDCAYGFSERSQPAPGGGFRNDSRGAGFDPSNRGYAALIQEGIRAFRQEEFVRTIELMDYALKATRDPAQFAYALMTRGASRGRLFQNDLALKDLNAALQYNPKLAGAYFERGWVLRNKNEFDAAIADYEHAIQLKPKNTNFYEAKIGALGELHRWNEALDTIRKEISANPNAANAYGLRARIEWTQGETIAALADADRALALDHNNRDAHITRFQSYVRLNKISQAKEELRVMSHLRLSGSESAKLNSVAWIRATCPQPQLRNGKEAVSMAKKACELSRWKSGSLVDTLAAACAETGDFASATKYEEAALKRPEAGPPPHESEMRNRLELYRQHQPYRDTKNG
jgi:Tfp pilus assembly protein PilF